MPNQFQIGKSSGRSAMRVDQPRRPILERFDHTVTLRHSRQGLEVDLAARTRTTAAHEVNTRPVWRTSFSTSQSGHGGTAASNPAVRAATASAGGI